MANISHSLTKIARLRAEFLFLITFLRKWQMVLKIKPLTLLVPRFTLAAEKGLIYVIPGWIVSLEIRPGAGLQRGTGWVIPQNGRRS
jgi:hypothetical protein